MAAVCESLKLARRELEEAGDKRLAAVQELEKVKQAAGAEPAVEAEMGLTGSMAAALAARNIVGPEAETLIAEVLQLYVLAKAGCGRSSAAPGTPVGAGNLPASAPQAAFLPLRTEGKGRPAGIGVSRGRSLPRDVPVPREDSSSRSPRGTREDEY